MRGLTGLSVIIAALAWSTGATADPVPFHPEGCDFEISFPSAPATSQTKTETDRGDSVATMRAVVNDGANYLRAECTHVPAMHFLDEDILRNTMRDMATSYKLDNSNTRIDHNDVSGPIGWLHGQGKLGGKDVTIEVRRFTGKASIFDVWIAAAPGVFPAPAEADFLKTIKADGKLVP
jgi:hypothetical protein